MEKPEHETRSPEWTDGFRRGFEAGNREARANMYLILCGMLLAAVIFRFTAEY